MDMGQDNSDSRILSVQRLFRLFLLTFLIFAGFVLICLISYVFGFDNLQPDTFNNNSIYLNILFGFLYLLAFCLMTGCYFGVFAFIYYEWVRQNNNGIIVINYYRLGLMIFLILATTLPAYSLSKFLDINHDYSTVFTWIAGCIIMMVIITAAIIILISIVFVITYLIIAIANSINSLHEYFYSCNTESVVTEKESLVTV
jgi:hypothetical protein